jgi:hypothetical protein
MAPRPAGPGCASATPGLSAALIIGLASKDVAEAPLVPALGAVSMAAATSTTV